MRWSRAAAAAGIAVPLQTLLPAGAVCPGIASRAVVAECAGAGSAVGLLSVSTGRVALRLIQIAAATVLVCAGGLLIESPLTGSLLLIQPSLIRTRLVHSRLIARAQLLPVILRRTCLIVLKLRLIVFLTKVWRAAVVSRSVIEVIGAVVAVDVIRVDVIAINVVAVYVVRVDVIAIDVVVVRIPVIIVAIDECVGGRNIGVAVVGHGRVVPPASP